MRTIVLGTVVASAMGIFCLSATAAPITRDVFTTQSKIEKAQYESRYCRRLRRACEYKDVRGEVGEGNCRRYRRECGRGRR